MLLIFRESSPESEAFRSGWVRGVPWVTEMLSSPHQEHCGQGFPPELWTYLSVLVCVCVSSTELLHTYFHKYYCFSVAKSCPTLCNPMDCRLQASLSFSNSWSLLKRTSFELVMSFSHLILSCLLLLLPSIFPSIRVFSSESALPIRWPKYWSFSFSISPPNEYSGLISSRIDWFVLLAVKGILKSLFQHHSSKASSSVLSLFYGPNLMSVCDYIWN